MVKKESRWFFGGTSSAMAITFTHPLDLIKVHLQTQQIKQFGFIAMGIKVVKTNGFLALYNGLSASWLRQIFYALPRFGIYDFYRNNISQSKEMPIHEKISIAAFSGGIAGMTGNPLDVINVRMQNDVSLAINKRRNYKHVFDGIYKVVKYEGPGTLLNGVSMTMSRAVFMTIGQVACYDELKRLILKTDLVSDSPFTHFISAIGAALMATFLAQPFDVMKTRLMNAPTGKYTGIGSCASDIFSTGFLSFYKGITPAFIRIGPHTVLLYLIKEQLIKYFGYIKI